MASFSIPLDWASLVLIILMVAITTFACTVLAKYCFDRMVKDSNLDRKSLHSMSACCLHGHPVCAQQGICPGAFQYQHNNYLGQRPLPKVAPPQRNDEQRRIPIWRPGGSPHSATLPGSFSYFDDSSKRHPSEEAAEQQRGGRSRNQPEVVETGTFQRLGIGGDDAASNPMLPRAERELENQQLSPIQNTPPGHLTVPRRLFVQPPPHLDDEDNSSDIGVHPLEQSGQYHSVKGNTDHSETFVVKMQNDEGASAGVKPSFPSQASRVKILLREDANVNSPRNSNLAFLKTPSNSLRAQKRSQMRYMEENEYLSPKEKTPSRMSTASINMRYEMARSHELGMGQEPEEAVAQTSPVYANEENLRRENSARKRESMSDMIVETSSEPLMAFIEVAEDESDKTGNLEFETETPINPAPSSWGRPGSTIPMPQSVDAHIQVVNDIVDIEDPFGERVDIAALEPPNLTVLPDVRRYSEPPPVMQIRTPDKRECRNSTSCCNCGQVYTCSKANNSLDRSRDSQTHQLNRSSGARSVRRVKRASQKSRQSSNGSTPDKRKSSSVNDVDNLTAEEKSESNDDWDEVFRVTDKKLRVSRRRKHQFDGQVNMCPSPDRRDLQRRGYMQNMSETQTEASAVSSSEHSTAVTFESASMEWDSSDLRPEYTTAFDRSNLDVTVIDPSEKIDSEGDAANLTLVENKSQEG